MLSLLALFVLIIYGEILFNQNAVNAGSYCKPPDNYMKNFMVDAQKFSGVWFNPLLSVTGNFTERCNLLETRVSPLRTNEMIERYVGYRIPYGR